MQAQPSNNNNNNNTQVTIHPLAIIGISDHQTRITTGGGKTSPLSSSSSSSSPQSNTITIPIIGLLFGYQNGVSVTIVDAEEVEYPGDVSSTSTSTCGSSSNKEQDEKHQTIQTKIELHQKVFPTHEVVGWYRVDLSRHPALAGNGENGVGGKDRNNNAIDGDDDDMVLPSERDLIIHNGWMKKYNQSSLFVLMDGNERSNDDYNRDIDTNTATTPGAKQNESSNSMDSEKDAKKNKNNIEDAREKLDREEQLPIAIYESTTIMNDSNTAAAGNVGGGGGGMVFVNLDFELETFEPERIAVEKVLQTQPKKNTTSSSTSTVNTNNEESSEKATAATASSSSTADTTDKNMTTTPPTTNTQSEVQIQSLISSIEAMNTRVAVLLDFLQKTQNGEIPPNYVLLRQVQSLIHQLPLVMGKSHLLDHSSSTSSQQIATSYSSEEKIPNEKRAMEFENEYDDMLIVSFLATIAKTTKAVLGYSEKFKVVNDSKAKNYGKSRYDHFKDDL